MKMTLSSIFAAIIFLSSSMSNADTLKIGGSGVALSGMKILADAFGKSHLHVDHIVLPSLGSSGGVKALIAGAIDIAVTSRPLKDSEVAAGAVSRVYAITPLVFATSAENPTDRVTTSDLVSIYNGTMTTWPSGEHVRLILRPVGETDSKLLRKLSGKLAEAVDAAMERPGLVITATDQENAEILEKTSGSLGVLALVQITTENRRLKVLMRDDQLTTGVDSDPDGNFSKKLYVVTTADSSAQVRDFVDFLFSSQGGQILTNYSHSLPQ